VFSRAHCKITFIACHIERISLSIQRVAKYAGVSTATVSRVLNAVPVVSESTVKNVQAALKALNYDPLAVKRGPKPGMRRQPAARKAGMIAIMTVGLSRDKLRFPVTGAVVTAISSAAKQNGIKVLLDEMPDLTEISSVIMDREVDGAVVFLSDEAPLNVLAELHRHVPVVWAMGGHAGPLPVDHVSENNLAIGYLAYARQRGQALVGAAADSGQSIRALLMTDDRIIASPYGADTITARDLPELIEAFAAMSPRPDGLFIDRDSTTVRVYPLLQKHGIQPGRDVTIISCDNEEMALSALSPRPASIELGTDELGGRIIRRLLLRIENREEPPIMIQTMPRLVPGDGDS
jgi:LacI family transcriptional regulator